MRSQRPLALERAAEAVVPAAAILLLWWLALDTGIGGAFFYDEAVYANLADHPFDSDYYSDPVFFRHPPLAYLVLGAVGRLLSGVPPEVAYRVTSLVAASIGLVFLWRALGGSTRSLLLRSAALLALATSSLFVRYSLSATMYPFVFCFLAWALAALSAGRRRQQNAAFALLLWTHYAGLLMFAAHLTGCRLRGEPWRSSLARHRAVLLASLPVLLLTGVGLAFHVARFDPRHLPAGWSALAFHVFAPLWAGLAYEVVRALRGASPDRGPGFALVAVCAFIGIAAVAPPFERYLYAFMPLFIVAGLSGLEQIGAAVATGARRRLVLAALAALFVVPSHLLADFELRHFVNAHADNNRYQGWREVVDVCHGERVLTNNGPSYAFYLARREGTRVQLSDLDEAGRLRRFKNASDLLERASIQRPGCIAVDRQDMHLPVQELITERLEGCWVALARPTLVYRCRWSDP